MDIDYSFMKSSDLVEVNRIESQSNPFPWSKENFQDCLNSGYYSLVQRQNKEIIGFSIQSFTLDESHLLNIGIDESKRRKGYGTDLMEKIILTCKTMNSKRLNLEVRVSNFSAISFYKEYGFKQVGMRKNYYRIKNGKEDALLMSKKITTWRDIFSTGF
tara:strand:- start:108903 stop:109379 length:477 start_codon:yes stop_codon:yes gene_type:complete